ncbi:TraR/DksA family transcriptional regulator [Luteipulveratus halotolerans]|nr:TraR/DksA C4-type zinc finger protein [Luteipulveratus halotolerans]
MPTPGSDAAAGDAVARLEAARVDTSARIARMEADLSALFDASRDSNADDEHDPEGQTIAYERAQVTSLLQQARTHLDELDDALARVRTGRYGVCDVCGQDIGAGRLEARPTATTCVAHAVRR